MFPVPWKAALTFLLLVQKDRRKLWETFFLELGKKASQNLEPLIKAPLVIKVNTFESA